MSAQIRVNPGDGEPFLVVQVSSHSDGGHLNTALVYLDSTPADLHRLADEMQASIDAGREAVA